MNLFFTSHLRKEGASRDAGLALYSTSHLCKEV